jgi:hypothetical protein
MHIQIQKKLTSILIAVTLLSVIVSTYYYTKYKEVSNLIQNPSVAGERERDKIVQQVSTLINLPSDEVPTLATVSEVEKLRDQPFFKNARNGDKVLVYATNRKAIMYRPEAHKIIEIAPIAINDQTSVNASDSAQVAGISQVIDQPQPQVTPSPIASFKVNIVTSQGVPGESAATYQSDLQQKFPELNSYSNSSSEGSFSQNVVVVINDSSRSLAQRIAQETKAIFQEDLPEGVSNDNSADIILILGNSEAI